MTSREGPDWDIQRAILGLTATKHRSPSSTRPATPAAARPDAGAGAQLCSTSSSRPDRAAPLLAAQTVQPARRATPYRLLLLLCRQVGPQRVCHSHRLLCDGV